MTTAQSPVRSAAARIRIRAAALALAVAAHGGVTSVRAGDRLPTPVAPETPVAAELAPGEAHRYVFALEAGQYARVTVIKGDMHLAAALEPAGGARAIEVVGYDSGPIVISTIAARSGPVHLDLRSLEAEGPARRHEITLGAPVAAGPRERHTLRAERAVAEGLRLEAEWTAAALERAVAAYEIAVAAWRAAGDERGEAATLERAGEVELRRSRSREALVAFERALALRRAAADRVGEARTLASVSAAVYALGDTSRALETARAAEALAVEVGDARTMAQAASCVGDALYFRSDMRGALDAYSTALERWRAVGDRRGEAYAVANLGYTYFDLRDIPRSLEMHGRALELWRAARHRQGEALALEAIGNVYANTVEQQRAFDFHRRALEIFRAIGDRNGEGVTLNGLGGSYESLGEYDEALRAFERAAAIFRATGQAEYEAFTLALVARSHLALERPEKTISIASQLLAPGRLPAFGLTRFDALSALGAAHLALGRKREAMDAFVRSLDVARQMEDRLLEAYALNNVGYVHDHLGEREPARTAFARSLALYEGLQYPSGETAARYNLARLERDSGDLATARTIVEVSLASIENTRARVVGRDLRAAFVASVHQHYELYVDVLMRLHERDPGAGLDALALRASERARARSLLDTLAEARIDVRKGVDTALLARERELRQAVDAKIERRVQLLSGPKPGAEAAAVEAEVRALLADYKDVQARIRLENPGYAALTQPHALDADEIRALLDADTTLVEYALGEQRSYAWVVTPGGLSSHVLPGRAEIEAAATRVYTLVTARQPRAGEPEAKRSARVARADADLPEAVETLGRMILEPVAGALAARRLVVVADGALQYIPFQLLSTPGDPAAPLVARCEITTLPSASALAALRERTAGREPGHMAVAVFADPVFDADDPRIARARRAKTVAAPGRTRGAFDEALGAPGRLSFPRLLASRDEADAIVAAAPPGTSMKAVDFDATRARALAPDLSRFRVLHFATHAILDTSQPELSGVVLSLYDAEGRPQPGILHLEDVYNATLPAELVVLSACGTGLGKDVRGEGLVGLTRGFMYAGTRRVLATAWKVDDEATAALMRAFYDRLFSRGLAPAAALREAQIEISSQRRWRAPYYWAAFALTGEWR